MFVLNALTADKRFKEGIIYVEATIQAFQRDSRDSKDTPFPLDLEIDKIAVTIGERSKAYEVGNNITPPRVINPYASKLRLLNVEDIPSIRVLKRRDDTRSINFKKGVYKRNSTQMYKSCLGIGHCISNPDTICYNIAKHQMCTKFIDNAENTQDIKSNFYRYKKDRKDKAPNVKISSKIDGIIRSMEDEGHETKDLAPIIHIAKAMALNSDSESEDSEAYK